MSGATRKLPSRNPQVIHFLVLLAGIALAYYLFPHLGQSFEPKRLDWRSSTIEGFGIGVTPAQIEAIRGSGKTTKPGEWSWDSPDLSLEKHGADWWLTGNQLECQSQTFSCGSRFFGRDMLENLERMKGGPSSPPPREKPPPTLQGALQSFFGPGEMVGEEIGQPILVYQEPATGKRLSFAIDTHYEYCAKVDRGTACVTLIWPTTPKAK